MDPQFEVVFTVDDYYDGPRSGVADFGGRPHYYRSLDFVDEVWDSGDAEFELSPISDDMRDLAVEAFVLWQRWQVASCAGAAPALPDEHAPRILPEDRSRYAELQSALAPQLRIDPATRVVARARFAGQSPPGRPLSGLVVRWALV